LLSHLLTDTMKNTFNKNGQSTKGLLRKYNI